MSSFTGSPKPLHRPTLNEGLFKFVEQETVVKGRTPMQAQRDADGTPHTRQGQTALRPPQPRLTLNEKDIVSKSVMCSTPTKSKVDGVADTAEDPDAKIIKAQSNMSSYLMTKGVNLPIKF